MRITIIMMLMIIIMIINLLLTTRCFGKLQNWWQSWKLLLRLFLCIKTIEHVGVVTTSVSILKYAKFKLNSPPLLNFNPSLVFWKAPKKPWESNETTSFFVVVCCFPEVSGTWEFVKWLTRKADLFDQDEVQVKDGWRWKGGRWCAAFQHSVLDHMQWSMIFLARINCFFCYDVFASGGKTAPAFLGFFEYMHFRNLRHTRMLRHFLGWVGWGGGCWRSWELATHGHATSLLGWGGVGDVDVPENLRHTRMLRHFLGWVGWGGGCWRSWELATHAHATSLLGLGGVGWGMLTFVRTCDTRACYVS